MRYLHLFVALFFVILHFDASAQKPDMPKFKVPKGFVLIEGANYQLTPEASAPVHSFYMSATEVSNKQYREFLDYLQKQGRTKDYEAAKVSPQPLDQLDDAFPADYFSNSAYDEYPVVNITRQGMDLYCSWLSEQIKQDKNSDYKLIARLPSALEWEFAATGGVATRKLPWDGRSLKNSKGEYAANFNSGEKKAKPNLVPVKSFEPTKNGLYNIMGNAAEMTNDPTQIVKGGSWHASESDLTIQNNNYLRNLQRTSSAIGFRPVIGIYPKSLMEVK